MAEKPDSRGVAGNPAVPFHYYCGTLAYRVAQLAGAVMAVYSLANPVRSVQIAFCCGSNRESLNHGFNGWSIHNRYRLTCVKAQGGIER
jgi:hypothetical protein